MLEEIRIRDLGVIEEAHLEFGPGLTVLTGETGAGKTMVLTALGMVLGNKVETTLVRAGAERAVCAARFAAPEALTDAAREEHGAETEEGLVLARMLTAEGRTRSLLGGASVPSGVLAGFGESLISIHGQGSTSRLLRPASQRALLDDFAGPELLGLRDEHRLLFQQAKDLQSRIDQLSGDRREAAREAAELHQLIADVEALAPVRSEISTLLAEIDRLSHADSLITAAASAHAAMSGEDGDETHSVRALLALMRRALESQRDVDPEMARMADAAADLAAGVDDLGQELSRYLDSVDVDPGRLESANSRLGALQNLLRRQGHSTDDAGLEELLVRFSEAGLRLLDLDGGEGKIAALKEELAQVSAKADALATALTSMRLKTAVELGAAVSEEIHALAMVHTTFIVNVEAGAHGPAGRDEVNFLLSVGDGEGVPVAKGASGGELSRVMLGLEVILASKGAVSTYVFDEVDAGVGGGAAIEVGRRLQRLARHAQVIVVTHLAQVAAFADAHFTVTKDSDGRVTSSTVTRLADSDRAAELARMMAGLAHSERARASGAELLALAASTRD